MEYGTTGRCARTSQKSFRKLRIGITGPESYHRHPYYKNYAGLSRGVCRAHCLSRSFVEAKRRSHSLTPMRISVCLSQFSIHDYLWRFQSNHPNIFLWSGKFVLLDRRKRKTDHSKLGVLSSEFLLPASQVPTCGFPEPIPSSGFRTRKVEPETRKRLPSYRFLVTGQPPLRTCGQWIIIVIINLPVQLQNKAVVWLWVHFLTWPSCIIIIGDPALYGTKTKKSSGCAVLKSQTREHPGIRRVQILRGTDPVDF